PGGHYGARQEVVHGNAERTQLLCECLGPVGNSSADRVGNAKARHRYFDRRGNHIYYPSVFLLFHSRHASLHHDMVADEMIGERLGELVRMSIHCTTSRGSARIVDKNIG